MKQPFCLSATQHAAELISRCHAAAQEKEECAMPCRSGSVARPICCPRRSPVRAARRRCRSSGIWWTTVRIISGRPITPPDRRRATVDLLAVAAVVCPPWTASDADDSRPSSLPSLLLSFSSLSACSLEASTALHFRVWNNNSNA